MRQDQTPDNTPGPPLDVAPDEIEPMGKGHRDADPPRRPEQIADPTGENGPSYEANQGQHGRDANPGGSTDPTNTRSHADSGDETGSSD